MGLWLLRRGQFAKAETYFRKAIETLTQRNPNPIEGEPLFNLGLTLRFLGRDDEAFYAFYKSKRNLTYSSEKARGKTNNSHDLNLGLKPT